MNFELKTLFEFQKEITEMQEVVIALRQKQAAPEVVTRAIERIDKLLEIYNSFSSFYYQAHFERQKNLYLKDELSNYTNIIHNLSSEIERLKTELAWQNQQD